VPSKAMGSRQRMVPASASRPWSAPVRRGDPRGAHARDHGADDPEAGGKDGPGDAPAAAPPCAPRSTGSRAHRMRPSIGAGGGPTLSAGRNAP
jgi:hypothetical protein